MAAALDGGICRIRLPGGVLTAAQARTVAQASRTFGNGIVELTNRANLQLRGIGAVVPTGQGLRDTPPDLIAALTDAGLGPTPWPTSEQTAPALSVPGAPIALATADADAVRNILISPAAGFDRGMRVDTRPLLAASLARLARRIAQGDATALLDGKTGLASRPSALDTACATAKGAKSIETDSPIADPAPTALPLSAKFAIQIDGGENLTVLGHHHDLWFCALDTSRDGALGASDTGDWFAFGLASSIPCEDETPMHREPSQCDVSNGHLVSGPAVGLLRAVDVPAAIDALVAHFLRLRTMGLARDNDGRTAGRLRDILAPSDHAARRAYVAAAFAAGGPRVAYPDWLMQWRRPRPTHDARRTLGLLMQAAASVASPGAARASRYALGVQSVLGRISPTQLDTLAALSERYGDGSLRITPWQGVILPNLTGDRDDDAGHARDAARRAGLIVDAHDPVTRLHACAGSTGCAKAGADTKADALRLAAKLAVRAPDDRPHAEVHLSGCERRCASAVTREFTLIALRPNRYALHRRNDGLGHDVLLCSDIDIDAAADRILKETVSP